MNLLFALVFIDFRGIFQPSVNKLLRADIREYSKSITYIYIYTGIIDSLALHE